MLEREKTRVARAKRKYFCGGAVFQVQIARRVEAANRQTVIPGPLSPQPFCGLLVILPLILSI